MRGSKPRRFVDVCGESMSIPDLASLCGLTAQVVRLRLYVGWSVERILQTPLKEQSRTICAGDVFGFLTVNREGPIGSRGRSRWYCSCECGSDNVLVRSSSLISGKTTTCGCRNKRLVDLTNKPLNELGSTVLFLICDNGKRAGMRGTRWQCRCACGRLFEERGDRLVRARAKRAWCTPECQKKKKAQKAHAERVGKANAGRKHRISSRKDP